MRTRRIRLEGPVSLDGLAPELEPLGYRRTPEGFERGGSLLVERVTIEPEAYVYRYVPRRWVWAALLTGLFVLAIGVTAVLAPVPLSWLSARGWGPRWILAPPLYLVLFVVVYSPCTWLYASLAGPTVARERETLERLLQHASGQVAVAAD